VSRRSSAETPRVQRAETVPLISGSRSSYYLFQQGGHRMAVALVDKGARLRVNDAIEVVVLEIYNGSVKIGLIEGSPAARGCEDASRDSTAEA
jgi:hypothetical protein